MKDSDFKIRLVPVHEAASRLGMSVSWMNKKRIEGGGCPYSKIGRRVMYDVREIDEWATKQRRNSTSEYP